MNNDDNWIIRFFVVHYNLLQIKIWLVTKIMNQWEKNWYQLMTTSLKIWWIQIDFDQNKIIKFMRKWFINTTSW